MKKGFTLVELSIVLVIIGLLTGGILVGQSLIDSAKLTRLVSDLRQYEVATTQFYAKFKQFPGDSAYFTPAGNSNKILDGTGCTGAFHKNESIQFWAHLSQAQMIKTSYPAISPDASWISEACPGGTHDQTAYYTGKLTPYSNPDPQSNSYASKKYAITALKGNASTNLMLQIYALPKDTLALENKMGAKTGTGETAIGLENPVGEHLCWTEAINPISCADPLAVFGQLWYRFPQN